MGGAADRRASALHGMTMPVGAAGLDVESDSAVDCIERLLEAAEMEARRMRCDTI